MIVIVIVIVIVIAIAIAIAIVIVIVVAISRPFNNALHPALEGECGRQPRQHDQQSAQLKLNSSSSFPHLLLPAPKRVVRAVARPTVVAANDEERFVPDASRLQS